MLLAVQTRSEEPLHCIKAVCTLSLPSCCPQVPLRSRPFIISSVLLQLGEAAAVQAAFISLPAVDGVLAIIQQRWILILLDGRIAEKMKISAAWCFETGWNLRYFQCQHNRFLGKGGINLNIFKCSTSNSSLLFCTCCYAVSQIFLICGFLQSMIFFCCHFFVVCFDIYEVDIICRCLLSGFILKLSKPVTTSAFRSDSELAERLIPTLWKTPGSWRSENHPTFSSLPDYWKILRRIPWGLLHARRWMECV